MSKVRLARVEVAAKDAIVQKLLWTVRQARPEKQAELLRSRLEGLDRPTRQAIYTCLTDAELEGLCGRGAQKYFRSLSDAELTEMVNDRTGTTGYKAFQRWRKAQKGE
jgi:hypothetical protein